MIGCDVEKVSELVGLPDDRVIGNMIAMGKRTKAARPKPGQLPLEEVVINDRFDA